jgi:hypothetical protein
MYISTDQRITVTMAELEGTPPLRFPFPTKIFKISDLMLKLTELADFDKPTPLV